MKCYFGKNKLSHEEQIKEKKKIPMGKNTRSLSLVLETTGLVHRPVPCFNETTSSVHSPVSCFNGKQINRLSPWISCFCNYKFKKDTFLKEGQN